MSTLGDSSEITIKILEADCSDGVKAALVELLDWEKKRLDKEQYRYKDDYKRLLSKHVTSGSVQP